MIVGNLYYFHIKSISEIPFENDWQPKNISEKLIKFVSKSKINSLNSINTDSINIQDLSKLEFI